MKRKLVIGIAVIFLVLLSGCGLEVVHNSDAVPHMRIYNNYGSSYRYLVDLNTDVVYIQGGHGITVCMKPDGTPLLASEIGL